MLKDNSQQKLRNVVEVDETYVGGKNKNRHYGKKKDGQGGAGKTPVFGAVQRHGKVVAKVVPNTEHATLKTKLTKKHTEAVWIVSWPLQELLIHCSVTETVY